MRLLQIVGRAGADGLHVYFSEPLDEEVAVFGVHYRPYRGSKHPDAIFFEYSAAMELHSAVQGRLPPERKEYAVGPFLIYHLFGIFRGHRQEIDAVGRAFRRLHRCYVGVEEDGGYAFLLQGLEGL